MIDQIFLSGHLKRLDNIIQWQERDVFNKESVSQHSFKVSVFTRMILEDIFKYSVHEGFAEQYRILKFKLNCLTCAIFHDWDEALFLRDISHSVKYNKFNGDEIRTAINRYVENEFDEEFQKFDDSFEVLYNSIIKVEDDVKKVVKLADWLALLYFCKREISLGNINFKETCEYCEKSLLKCASEIIPFLKKKYPIDINEDDFYHEFEAIIETDINKY